MSNVIGLLPAGGQATRLSPLPMSKELYPLGFRTSADGRTVPKVVSHYLLEKMQRAGIAKAFFILRPGKWDIPAYYGDGALVQMRLGYLTVHVPYGVPYTLDQAYPFLQGATVAIGFPDILFQPENAYAALLERLARGGADVVLGLFPTKNFRKAGMVQFDEIGRVQQIVEKPQQTDLTYMWAIAVWSPRFTEFLHEFASGPIPETEVPIGDVIQAGINAGLRVEAEAFPDGSYLDVGTPDDLARAIRQLTPPEG
ncbi:dTDP-glucose pyrophosphorylase [Thermoleptolyngbya sichuanensis A183]|uniref:Glucose-1-phosphate thymidylyltransferase n=1 Tax=Thermoleptolyngbya sichuanensis A183 TaxID=2737172 RepID=A0A6M8BB02_9CYAN|nr:MULTISPECIES: sugar phosphate nucleotidyltransferase [Thermoleptolyngbya]QKD84489.1 dTDP-glucose pyrophosphorylase [Thermoleptolyngbya sichuanensis A183]